MSYISNLSKETSLFTEKNGRNYLKETISIVAFDNRNMYQ